MPSSMLELQVMLTFKYFSVIGYTNAAKAKCWACDKNYKMGYDMHNMACDTRTE